MQVGEEQMARIIGITEAGMGYAGTGREAAAGEAEGETSGKE